MSAPDVTYTSCYCEENIWLLCATFFEDVAIRAKWDIYAAFISNERKSVRHLQLISRRAHTPDVVSTQVALWSQKASRTPDGLVVWDYHVVLCLRSRGRRPAADEPYPGSGSGSLARGDIILHFLRSLMS
jgi:protein N-terminal glutamine amidohydrolase